MMTRKVIAVIVGCWILSVSSVHAELFVVNFEDLSVNPGTSNVIGGFSTVTDKGIGLTINSTFATHSIQNALHGADNGSTYLAISGQGGTNVLRIVDDADLTVIDPFTLVSVDLAENRLAFQTADRVVITGFINSGGTKIKEVTLDGVYDGPGGQADFETVTFIEWDDLTHITFQGFRENLAVQGWFALDNITASDVPIPEPGVFSLIAVMGLWFPFNRRCHHRKC